MKKVFLTIAILTTPITVHAACTQAPDCATLGYTKTATDCPNGGVKCPFDSTKMFCSVSNETCELGSILFSDMTCSFSIIQGKTPIGVVGYIKDNKRLAVSLDSNTLPWGRPTVIPGVANYAVSYEAVKDSDGKKNTALIVASLGSNTNYAAGYCYNYKTTGTKQGDWYLPAFGELEPIMILNKSYVDFGLSRAGGVEINKYYSHWTSTECDDIKVWYVSNHYNSYSSDKTDTNWVRCIMSF